MLTTDREMFEAHLRMADDAMNRAETGVGGDYAVKQLEKAQGYLAKALELAKEEALRPGYEDVAD